MKTWGIAALTMSAALSAGAAWADGPPANLKPTRIDGAGLNVMDLEAQKAWYMAKLGMTLTNTISRDGKPREYIMGYGEGPNAVGRIILAVPNAKGLADWLKTQGVDNREVIANVAYFINDPEGNAIELYSAPKP